VAAAEGILSRWFGRNRRKGITSTTNAKSRLHFVLVQDRAGLQPEELNSFRREMIEVINKYFQINEENFDISYQRGEETTTLVINSPVSLKRPEKVKAISEGKRNRDKDNKTIANKK